MYLQLEACSPAAADCCGPQTIIRLLLAAASIALHFVLLGSGSRLGLRLSLDLWLGSRSLLADLAAGGLAGVHLDQAEEANRLHLQLVACLLLDATQKSKDHTVTWHRSVNQKIIAYINMLKL